MGEKLNVHKEVIPITEGRTMNIYTFDLDGVPMPEMEKSDIVETVDATKEEHVDPK